MKLLIDLTSLSDNLSGLERFAAQIAYELTLQSQDDFILLFKESIPSMFVEVAKRDNIQTVIIKRCGKLLFHQLRLPRVIMRYTADAYLFLAFPPPLLLQKKNMIAAIHDISCWDCPETMKSMSKWYFRLSNRAATRKCKAIVTVSQFSKQRIIVKLRVPAKKIWVIHNGVGKQFTDYGNVQSAGRSIRQKYALPEEYILSLSTLEPRKNLQLLVDAHRELMEENSDIAPLVLAGRTGWKTSALLAAEADNGNTKICFTGFVEDADLPALYGNAKLFVFPSKYEGFGLPPLEAMACGTRVVASDAASLPEILGGAAVYFSSENKESLKTSMKEAMQLSDDACAKRVSSGKEQAMKYDWAVEAEKLLQYIKN